MALSKLSGDEQGILFVQLCNVLDPGVAVALSSVSNELRTATQALQQQLRADHKAAAALCRKMGMRSCKGLREAKRVDLYNKGLTVADLTLLGTLGSVLPALEVLSLNDRSGSAGPEGVQRLAEGLGAGALPAVTYLAIGMHLGDAGASALAVALGQGALPRLKSLSLYNTAIGDAGLVALAPALRRRPALEGLFLAGNPFGDEGLAALVAPPPPAGAPPPPAGELSSSAGPDGMRRLAEGLGAGALPAVTFLDISGIHVGDAGASALAVALGQGTLPRLKRLSLHNTAIGDAGLVARLPHVPPRPPLRPCPNPSDARPKVSHPIPHSFLTHLPASSTLEPPSSRACCRVAVDVEH